jgi:starch-binding outer membrane protein, SusD/RagB family
MKTIYKISIIAVLFLLQFSCTDPDWLDPRPLSFYAPENVYVDEEGFEALLVTMRKDIKGEHYDERSTMSNEYAMSDLAVPGAQSVATVKDFPRVLTPAGDGGNHDFPGRLFNLAYNSIRSTNVLVSRIDNIEWENEATRNRLLASAYFYRSYWYYRLVNSYGDVPFISEEITGPKLDFYTHSRSAILKKIQDDMEWAIQWLPEQTNPGAASKGAGRHLLAKIALANSDFDKAIEASSEVINGPYRLMTTRFGIDANDAKRNVIWDLHRPDNIHHTANTETILGVVDRFTDPAGAKTAGNRLPRTYNPAWWHARVRDSKGAQGTAASGLQYDTLFRGNGNVRPTPYYLYEIWDYENDLRRSDVNWVEWYEIKYNNPTSVDYGKPINRANFPSQIDTFQHNFSFPHYKTFVPEQDPASNMFGGNGDSYIFRLAETYLLRAEAYFWKGELTNAANDLNMVRQRAGALPISTSEVDIDFIFDERARELFTESPRHGEMVRVSYIMAKNNLNGYTLANFHEKNWFHDRVMAKNVFFQINLQWGAQSYHIAPHNALWPIPEDVISSNTLGVINQNIGYFGADNNKPPLETIE